MEKAVPTSPHVGHSDAGSPLLLVFARTEPEEAVLRTWMDDTGRTEATAVHAGRGELGEWLARNGSGDPQVLPVRVAWLPVERGGVRRARLREVLALRDPRRPTPGAQARIAEADPERARVIVGEPARVSDLRDRHSDRENESFETFVERQGLLALDRAEREVIGGQYKVPRLVREDIVASPRFTALVDRLAAEHGRSTRDVAAEATAALDEMVASQSRLAIDAWDHFGHWVARAYTVDVDESRLDELRRLNRSHALVFLPSHRSYMDTLVLRPVLHSHGFPPNHVMGGSNLDFWPLGSVARRNGYVFIRRSMKDAPIYKAVLREYLGYLLRKRFNLEWYIEGGRTRTGKLRPPRYGILRYVLDAFREGGIEDVYLVPVSIVYDQLHEVGAMAAEEHGARKQAEGLSWIVNYTRAQRRPFGAAHIAFGEPLSLAATEWEDGTVPKTAFEVLHRINQVAPITPSTIVALALLDGQDRALTFDEGRRMLRPFLEYVDARGLPKVAGIEVGRTDVVQTALSTLIREGVVTEFTGGTEPVYRIAPDKHVEAAFYRNNAIHHFVTRAITELALLRVAEGDFADPADEVWQEALRLRDLLKFEFFFSRKRDFADEVRAEMSILAPGWEDRPAESEQVIRVLEEAPALFAHRVVGSFLEAYVVVADRLVASDPTVAIDEDDFVRACLGVARQHLWQKRLNAPESLSRELFRGALRLAENRGLMEGDDLAARRGAFAAELHDAVRRVDTIRAWAHRAGRGAS